MVVLWGVLFLMSEVPCEQALQEEKEALRPEAVQGYLPGVVQGYLPRKKQPLLGFDLEAFSHEPTDGSFSALAFQLT